MFIEERHEKILEMLKEKGRIYLSDIQEAFDISVDSARRDLRILEGKNKLKRTHGGAIPILPRSYTIPEGFTHREIKEVKANYLAIAKRAVDMIEEGDVIHINGGSIGYFMVQNLPKDKQMTIAVNNIVLADVLRTYDNVTTIMIGGYLNSKGQCKEQLAVDMIKALRFDKAFITSATISTDFGASIQTPSSVSLIRAFMEASTYNIGLYPNEKIQRNAILHICDMKDFDTIITDWQVIDEHIEKMKECAQDLVVVEEI